MNLPSIAGRGRLRWVPGIFAGLALAAVSVVTWFRISVWPGSMLIRAVFNRAASSTSRALEPHLPEETWADIGRTYDPGSRDGSLDLFYPEFPGDRTRESPVVVWVHGGAWISGSRVDIANYLQILASRGIVAVGVDYSIAPEATYPRPVEQINEALRYLDRRAEDLGIDAARIVLAGDSAGSQIAAQVALLNRNPDNARLLGITPGVRPEQIRATLLNCGAYDLELAGGSGVQGWFLNTALSAYSGLRDFRGDERFARASILGEVDHSFPPTFITAGNEDPLLPHSERLADRLRELEVPVDELFFPAGLEPGLGHEYQFDLDRAEGREALERLVRFTLAYG